MTSVELVWITPNADQMIADMARVSSPANVGKDATRLIRYLITHKHWSPFEMVSACFDIRTYRAISAQIIRHRSFAFQEFSQRYADVLEEPPYFNARKPAAKNRQSSEDEADGKVMELFDQLQCEAYGVAYKAYYEAIAIGVPREQARFLLPLATPTRLYMAGTVRSWIHYTQLRTEADTQQEHREIAFAALEILRCEMPLTFAALEEVAK